MNRSYAGAKLVVTLLAGLLFSLSVTVQARPSTSVSDASSSNNYTSYQKELECLARAIYFEARGEPHRGQEAVALVILNRVKSEYYPDTVCKVVYQNAHMRNACQFSFACDGKPDTINEKEAYAKAENIATQMFSCENGQCKSPSLFMRSTHYHADYVSPRWAKKLQRTGQVGRHIFYYTASM